MVYFSRLYLKYMVKELVVKKLGLNDSLSHKVKVIFISFIIYVFYSHEST